MRTYIRTISTTTSESSRASSSQKVKFSISSVPPNPLGDGNYIRTAAALVIGWVPLFRAEVDTLNSYPNELEMRS